MSEQAHTADHHGDHEHEHRLMPHVLNLLALFVLTALTYGVALIHLGEPWADLVALAIAMLKASLVILIFMHVKESSGLVKVAAFSGFFWVFLFFFYLWADVVSRDTWTTFSPF
ncbi:MAG: cytochrome C oxidase subunit IV family protein [Thermoanaerobaculia bacterium]|nr:cytochrome C oxidase subunit IV family protein [Thermoanaerobaculia bacterium]